VAENRGAWLTASSAFSATLITLGLVFLLGESNEERGSDEPQSAMAQPAAPRPEKSPSKAEPAAPYPPASPSPSPREAVDRLLDAWIQDDRVAARRLAAQPAVERFFEEPLEYRPDFYVTGCSRHEGDWNCSLGFRPDDRVGYNLAVEHSDRAYWVERADLIVL
jgi:hypothetical protein